MGRGREAGRGRPVKPEEAREQGLDPEAVRVGGGERDPRVETDGQGSPEGADDALAVDRIANPWGERTPFGPGEDWPVRVGWFLEEGVSEDELDRWVQTAS